MHFVRAGVVCLCLLASSARAQAPARGLAPDAQVTGGIGAALNGKLDNVFLGRLRLGLLYAFEPLWVDAGALVEVGSLPGLSIGGELELNQFHGWFGNVGLAYAEHQRVTGHLTLGYLVFGIEWQHDFTRSKPNDALLASVRLPLGFWWFTSRSEKKSAAPPPSAAKPARVGSVRSPPAAAKAPARSPAQADLDAAVMAQIQGDHAGVAAALRRAYAAEPDPSLWLRIADADQAQGKQALALEDLQRFLASAPAGSARTQAEARVQELDAQVARVRLALAAAGGGESVEVDGVAQPAALVGYDVVIDPGTHQLRILRAGEVLLERTFEARPGELVRLDVQLPAAEAPAR